MARESFTSWNKRQRKQEEQAFRRDAKAEATRANEQRKSGYIQSETERGDTDQRLIRLARMANDIKATKSRSEAKSTDRLLNRALNSEQRYRNYQAKQYEQGRVTSPSFSASSERPGMSTSDYGSRYRSGGYSANTMRRAREAAGAAGTFSNDYRRQLKPVADARLNSKVEQARKERENQEREQRRLESMSVAELKGKISELENSRARNQARLSTDGVTKNSTNIGTPTPRIGYNNNQGTPTTQTQKTGLTKEQRDQLVQDNANIDDMIATYKKYLLPATKREEEAKLSEEERKVLDQAAELYRRENAHGAGMRFEQQEAHNDIDPKVEKIKAKGVDTDWLIETYATEKDNAEQEMRNQAYKDFAGDSFLGGLISNTAEILASPMTALQGAVGDASHAIRQGRTDKPVEVNQSERWLSNASDTIKEATNENIEKIDNPFLRGFANLAYNAGMAAGESGMAILAGAGLGGAAGAGSKVGARVTQGIMSIGAAQGTYNTAVQEGMDPQRALSKSLLAGAAEWFTEKYSIDSLKSMAAKRPEDIATLIRNIQKQMLVEGSEEAASDVINTIGDSILNGSKSEFEQSVRSYMKQGLDRDNAKRAAMFDWIKSTGYDAALGAISGGIMGGGAEALSFRQVQNDFNSFGNMVKKTGDLNSVIQYAKKFNDLTKDAEKVEGVKFTDKESNKVGKLADSVQEKVEKAIMETTNAVELQDAYNELIEDAPDIVRANIDSVAIEKAMQLSEQTEDDTEQYILEGLTDEAQDSYTQRVDVLNKRLSESKETEAEHIEAEDARVRTRETETGKESKAEPRIFGNTQARLVASKEPVHIDGFENIGTKDVKVKIDGGQDTVRLEDLEFDNHDVEMLYAAASTMDDAAAASAMISEYDGRQSVSTYFENFEKAYNFGSVGMNYDAMMKKTPFVIPEATVKYAYMLGKNYDMKQLDKIAETYGEPTVVARKGEGTVTDVRDEIARDGFEDVDKALAKKLGVDIKLVDVAEDTDGSLNDKINGYLDIKNGKMVFSNAAESKLGVRIHETMEFIEAVDPKAYKNMMYSLMSYMAEESNMNSVYKMVMRYRDQYRDQEGEKTFDEAMGEFMNDAVSGAFMSEDGARDFIAWLHSKELSETQEKSVLKTIIDAIASLINKIKESISHLTGAQKVTAQMKLETQEKIRDLFINAAEEASMKYKGEEVRTGEKIAASRANSIKVRDGIEYVRLDVDPELFEGLQGKEFEQMAKEVIREYYQGKVIGNEGNKEYIDGRVKYEYTTPAKPIKDQDTKEAKMKASRELDNLVKASVFEKHEDDGKDGHTHEDATGGFDYYQTLFSVPTENGEKYFIGRINVMITDRGRRFHDLTKIERGTWDRLSRRIANLKFPSSSNKSITHSEENASENRVNSVKILSKEDSHGRDLSKEQQEFFKDSKIRDKEGRLRVVYHGTNDTEFNIFDESYIGTASGDDGFFGRGFYFAYSQGEASYYGSKRIIPAYINVKNPFNFRAELGTYNGEEAKYGYAPDAVRLLNFAEKFPEIAKDEKISVARHGSDDIEEISLEEFAKEFKNVIENKKFTRSTVKNQLGEEETLVTADEREGEYEYEGKKETYKYYEFEQRFYKDAPLLDVAYSYLSKNVYSYIDMHSFLSTITLPKSEEFTDALKKRGYDGVIQSEEGDEVVAFYPNQIKSIENKTPTKDADIRYSLKTDSEGRELTEGQRAFFKDSKVVDETGALKVMYHGTARADRVGFYFDPKRATSGPMAYFTDNEEIAENYSKDKADTSLDYEDAWKYENQFVVNVDGEEVRLVDYWNRLPMKEKQRLDKAAHEITYNWDTYELTRVPGNKNGQGGYASDPFIVRESKGNVFKMLEYAWLESGDLYGEEESFLDVLRLAGIDDVIYKDPNARDEKVYEVYLNVTSPLKTSDITESFADEVEEWLDDTDLEQYAEESANADMWDKRALDPYDWVERLRNDIENGTTHVWTVVPDAITAYLKEKGYDGIFDEGGKHGGLGHMVVIPFYSEQIKSVDNENPTKENPDIRYSLKINQEEAEKHVAAAEKRFGTTTKFTLAGYLDINGKLLDFSDGQRYRVQDHREIEEILDLPEDAGYSDGLIQFMNEGNIRLQEYGIDISVMPNEKQKPVLLNFFRKLDGEVTVDFSNEYGDNDGSIDYEEGTPADRILKDIETYFKTGSIPEQSDVRRFFYSRKIDGLRHSVSDTADTYDLAKENEHLKQVVSNLEKEFKLTGGTMPDPEKIKRAAGRILRKYKSKFDKDTLIENITNVYKYLRQEGADAEEATRVMAEIAKGVLEKTEMVDTTMYDQYKDLRDQLRTDGVTLSEKQKEEVAYSHGSYGKYMQKNRSRIRVREDGTPLDTQWKEWEEQYPELFPAGANELEMPVLLEGIREAIDKHVETLDGQTIDQMAYEAATEIYAEIAKVPPKETFADKKEREKYEALEHLAESYENLVEAYRRDNKATNEAELKETLEQVEKERKARRAKIFAEIKGLQDAKKDARSPKTLEQLQKAIDKKNAQIERMNAQSAKKEAEIRLKYQNQRLKQAEQRKMTETKDKIRKLHQKFRTAILKPKESIYVPAELMQKAIEVCELVNLGAKEGTKLYDILDDARRAFDEIKKDEEHYTTDDFNPEIGEDIDRLALVFRDKEDIYQMTAGELQEVYDCMNEIYEAIRRSTILIREEGEKDVRRAGKRVIKDLQDVKGVKDNFIGRRKNALTSSLLNAYREFRRLSGYKDDAELMELYRDLNAGQRKMYDIQKEGEEMLQTVTARKDMQSLMNELDDKKGLVKVPLRFEKSNSPVFITRGMRLALILHSESYSNLNHMMKGGVMIPADVAKYSKNKKEAYERTRKVVGINEATVAQMRAELSEKERELLTIFEKFFHDWTGSYINQTSFDLYGFKKARVQNYYPINVDKDFVTTDISSLKFDKTIEGAGFLKERIESVKPIVLESVIDTAERSLNAVSMFSGLAIPIRNFNKVMNVTTYKPTEATESLPGSEKMWTPDTSVKKEIKEVWGERTQKYFDDVIADLQKGRSREITWYDKLRGNYAGAVLTANASVIIKQTSAYPTCAAITGWAPTIKAMFRGGKHNWMLSKADQELIGTYTPIYWFRNKGNATRELAEIRDTDALVNKIPPVRFVKDAIQKVDMAMVGRFWYAAQYYIDSTQKDLAKRFKADPQNEKLRDQYYSEVAKVFDRCVEETQSTNMTLQNADIMRNPSDGMKLITMFMGQGLQNFGIVYDNFNNVRAKRKQFKEGKIDKAVFTQAKKGFANALSSQVVSAMMFAGLAIVARGLLHRMNPYRDDEKDITPEGIFDKWIDDALENMIGSVPLGSFAYEWSMKLVTGERPYGQDDIVLGALSDFEDATIKLFKAIAKGEGISDALLDVAQDGSKLFGVPVENVANLIKGSISHAEDITSGEGFLSFESDANRSASMWGKKLVQAIESGDKASAEKFTEAMVDLGKSEDDIAGAIAKIIKMNDDVIEAAENKTSEKYADIKLKYVSKGYPAAAFEKAVKSILNAKNKKAEEKPDPDKVKERMMQAGSLYDAVLEVKNKQSEYNGGDLAEAVESGKGVDRIVETMLKDKVEQGIDKEEAVKRVGTAIKTALTRAGYKATYMSGTAHEKQEVISKLQKIKIDGKVLYDQETFLKWNKEAEKLKA